MSNFFLPDSGQPRRPTAATQRQQNAISHMHNITAVITCSSRTCDYTVIRQGLTVEQLSPLFDDAACHVCGFGSGFRKQVQLTFFVD